MARTRTVILTYCTSRTTGLGFVRSIFPSRCEAQGSRRRQFNDLTTKSKRAPYCISKIVRPRQNTVEARAPQKQEGHFKNFVRYLAHYARLPFFFPVLIRDLTVCAAWFDNRDQVGGWVAGERTTQ